MGVVADVNYLGTKGRNLYNAYNINRYVGDLLDGTLQRVQPELPADQHGDVDVEVGLPGRHRHPAPQLPEGLDAAGGVHVRQGDERR